MIYSVGEKLHVKQKSLSDFKESCLVDLHYYNYDRIQINGHFKDPF